MLAISGLSARGADGRAAGSQSAQVARLRGGHIGHGQRFRILVLVDDFAGECFGLVMDASLTALRVAREVKRIAELRGYPCTIVSGNSIELTSDAILAQ